MSVRTLFDGAFVHRGGHRVSRRRTLDHLQREGVATLGKQLGDRLVEAGAVGLEIEAHRRRSDLDVEENHF